MTISGSGTWAVTWPWPQMFLTQYYTLVAAKGTGGNAADLYLFELYNSSDTWYATAVGRLGVAADIMSVDVASFGTFYVVAVRKTGHPHQLHIRNPNSDSDSDALVQTDDNIVPRGISTCNFKGQAIIGGVNSNNSPWDALGNCSVAWSGIGNFTFDIEKDKTAGFRNLEWDDWGNGKVLKVLRLGDNVMCYGDNGAAALVPSESTFGMKDLTSAGIPHTNAVAGNATSHLVLDNNNDLWTMGIKKELVGASIEVVKLGYREFMEGLTTASVKISYVPQLKRFYISDTAKCYCLTEFGLYENHQPITAAGVYRGVLCGFMDQNADYEIRLTSDDIDFGIRGFKTLEELEIGATYRHSSGATNLQAGVKYKSDYHVTSFTQGSFINLDPAGFCMPIVSAHEFQLQVKAADYRGATINVDYINAWFKVIDKRGLRGRYDSRNAS
jgi:hypothetical protein